jgi:hypothetical protein
MSHYYIHDGAFTKRLLEKMNKDKRLKEIADRLRSATGEDRKELLEERDQLRGN